MHLVLLVWFFLQGISIFQTFACIILATFFCCIFSSLDLLELGYKFFPVDSYYFTYSYPIGGFLVSGDHTLQMSQRLSSSRGLFNLGPGCLLLRYFIFSLSTINDNNMNPILLWHFKVALHVPELQCGFVLG